MIEEIKVNGTLYKPIKMGIAGCKNCDLAEFCKRNNYFSVTCYIENNNYIFKKQ